MNLKILSKIQKNINNNLPYSTNLQLERIEAKVDDRYLQIKAFLTRMHWSSLRSLGQVTISESIGLVYQLIELQKRTENKSEIDPTRSFWLQKIKADVNIITLIDTNEPKLAVALNENNYSELKGIIEQQQTSQKEKIVELGAKVTGLIAKSLLSVLHGNINATIINWDKETSPSQEEELLNTYMLEQKESVLADLKITVKNNLEAIDQKIFSVYQIMLKEPSTTAMLSKAIDLANWASKELVEIGDFQNLLNNYIQLLQSKNKNSFSEKIGAEVAYLGNCTRQIIATVVSAFELVFDLAQGNATVLQTDIKKMGFAMKEFPNGKNVAIHKLEKTEEDAFVEIAGFIKEIEALRTSKGALICRAKLYDPSSKKTVWIATLYTHLAHLGIDVDTYVVVHGKLKQKSNLAQKEMAVHIDILEKAPLAKESWKLLFLEAASPFFQVWYNGMNIKWSLTRHKHNHAEKKFIKVGAAEMMFQPLYRSEEYKKARKLKYTF